MNVDVNLVINGLKQQIADQAVAIAMLQAQITELQAIQQNYEIESVEEDAKDG